MEAAAFAAWPAAEEMHFHGWRLRLGNGYTRRANSANRGSDSIDLGDEQLRQVERVYRERGLTPVFRLTSFSRPQTIDGALAARGYRFTDPSLVMAVPLDTSSAHEAMTFLQAPDAERWHGVFQQVSGAGALDGSRHLALLKGIRSPCSWAFDVDAGSPVCCGLGVPAHGHLGLFDVATHRDFRGRGLARRLCSKLLAWGAGSGAHTAFLQVAASNTAAIGLYESLGFRRVYDYWYRVAA